MSLVDKIQATGEGERISGHAFKDILTLWLAGDYTNGEASAALALAYPNVTFTAQMNTQLTELKAHFDGLSVNGQQTFILKLDPAFAELRSGRIDGAKWKSITGVTS